MTPEVFPPHPVFTPQAHTFIHVLLDFWPIAVVGAVAGVVRGMRKIACEHTLQDKLYTLIFAALSGGGMAFTGTLCLPLIFGYTPSVEMQVGLAGLLGGMGNQIFSIILRKVFKLKIVGSGGK